MGMGSPNELEQAGFRGRFDDGVESLQESDGGATWIAALNTDWDQMPGLPFRMRILINHPIVGTTFPNFMDMFYSLNGAPYLNISDTSLAVRVLDTVHWANGDDPTDFVGRLGSGNWDGGTTFALIDDGSDTSFKMTAPSGVQTEIETEWNLQLRGEDLSPGDTIDFRVFEYPATPFTRGYIFTPRLTVLDPEGGSQMTGAVRAEPVLTAKTGATAVQALAFAEAEPVLIAETEAVPVLEAKTEATIP